MLLQIARNPHYKNPESFEKVLTQQYEQITKTIDVNNDEIDREGLKSLKSRLIKESKLLIVKG